MRFSLRETVRRQLQAVDASAAGADVDAALNAIWLVQADEPDAEVQLPDGTSAYALALIERWSLYSLVDGLE